MNGSATDWLSAYLFHHGDVYGAECDRVLLDSVAPFVAGELRRGTVDQWFFIRYRENGSHVRLRMRGHHELLQQIVKPALEEHLRRLNPALIVRSGTDKRHGASMSNHGQCTSVQWATYEPELSRYGGADGVALAELMFQVSSNTAIALLRQIDGSVQHRLGQGLLAMLVTMQVFLRNRECVTELAHNYRGSFLQGLARSELSAKQISRDFEAAYSRQEASLRQYLGEAWSRLDDGGSLSDALDALRSGLVALRERFAAVEATESSVVPKDRVKTNAFGSRVISSYVHMTSNRLGIPIAGEAYLAYLIAQEGGRSPRAESYR